MAPRHCSSCAWCKPLRRRKAPSCSSDTELASTTTAIFSSGLQSWGRFFIGLFMVMTLSPASRSHRERVVWPTPTSWDKALALGPPGDANRRTIFALKAVEYTTIELSFLPIVRRENHAPPRRGGEKSSNSFDNCRDHHSASSHMVRGVCCPAQLSSAIAS